MRRQGLSTYHLAGPAAITAISLAGVGLTGMLSEQSRQGFSWGWTRSVRTPMTL